MLAYLALQMLLLAITELASIGHHFTAGVVTAAWALVTVSLVVLARSQLARGARWIRSPERARTPVRSLLRRLRSEEAVWTAVIVVILGVLVVEGSIYLPANGDSMVYHLVRVAHWVQNRTIAPFATHYVAQVELSPQSEYNLAHLHLLTGTDRFDWSMQWSAAVVCIVGVSEFARQLGATRAVQMTASVICATLPSGILLATTTENDYFAAATGIGLLIILGAFSFDRGWIGRTVALGGAAGLAWMAKGTMPTMLGPAVVALLAVAVYRWHRGTRRIVTVRQILKWLSVAGASALAVVGPFVVQTWQLFGSVVGPTSKSTIDQPISLASFGVNLIRASAGNFEIGDGTSGISTYTSMIVLGVLRHLPRFGISPNDPRFTIVFHDDPFRTADWSLLERVSDYGANPWHVILAMVALAILVVAVLRGARQLRVALVVAVALTFGYILFSGIARWSPFEVRYALPLLVAWSAVIAVALGRWPRWVSRLVMVGLVIACLPELLNNALQPLVPVNHFHGSFLAPYFPDNQTATGNAPASNYQTVTSVLTQSTCTHAALGNWVLIEYPLWVALGHDHWTGQLNDFNVHNQTTTLEPSYRPCAWITQEAADYSGPDNGTVNIQQGSLALSIQADDAATVRTPIRGWASSVPGVRVLPGGGWFMSKLTNFPLLGTRGSVYVYSRTARTVQLQLHFIPQAPRPAIVVTGPDGATVAAVGTSATVHAEIAVHAGTNRIGLETAIAPRSTIRQALLQLVTVAPAAP